jgi:hypothetical protein
MQSGALGSAPSPLAGNDLKRITLQCAHNNGLNYAALADRVGKLTELGIGKQAAWIARIGPQTFNRRAAWLAAAVGNRRFVANVADQCSQAASQSRVIRHCCS